MKYWDVTLRSFTIEAETEEDAIEAAVDRLLTMDYEYTPIVKVEEIILSDPIVGQVPPP